MRLSLLAKREPIADIVEQTLAGFLSRWQQRPYEVRWHPGRPRLAAIRNRGDQPWLCNFYLNAMFPIGVDPQALEPLKREFSRSPRWWCRPLQKLYVDLAFSPSMAPLFAHAALGISPPLDEATGLVFVAGNYKLRLLDRRRGEVHCMLKNGFPPAAMQRELAARKLAAELGLPVPALKAAAADGTWLTEAYVSGTPLNRLADEGQARWAVDEVVRHLQSLAERTLKEETLGNYLAHLEDQITAYLSANPLFTQAQVQAWRQMTGALLVRLRLEGPQSLPRVLLALSHGDLQPGNILVNGATVWLIDWEYAALRQLSYDPLVFLSGSRFPRGMARRLQGIVEQGPSAGWAGLLWVKDFWATTGTRRLSVDLFLLEELALRLQENTNPWFRELDEGLMILEDETCHWLRVTG